MATTDELKIDNLDAVENALWDARAKWKKIGKRIGVDDGTLATFRGDDDDCFSEMLSHWLRGVYNPKLPNSKPRTWRTLIEALQSQKVNEAELAKKIEKEKYPQGLPVSQPAANQQSGGQPPASSAGNVVHFEHNKGQTIQATIINVGRDARLQLPGHPTPAAPGSTMPHQPPAPQPEPGNQQPGKRMAMDGDQDIKGVVPDTVDDDQELEPLNVDEMCPDTQAQITNRGLLPPEQLKIRDIHTAQELQGQGVEIAILDTGIHFKHDVFSTKERNDIKGYDFLAKTGDDPAKSWKTPGLHGTAVAAVAAGNKYIHQTNCPIAGIAPEAKLYICRISDGKDYPWECLIQALDHLIEIKTDHPDRIDIAVMSFGSKSNPGPDNVRDKLRQLTEKGVILIAAGGNEGGWQNDNNFPASCKHVIPIGAFRGQDAQQAGFSSEYTLVDAPGDDIVVPSLKSTSDVCQQRGTSFATPMVAGFLALLLQCVKEKYPMVNEKVKAKYPTEKHFMKKFHDDDFIRGIFRNRLVVQDKTKRLMFAKTFLESLKSDPENIAKLIL